jgi:hypothetical protein
LADSTRMRSRHPYTVPAVARHSMGLALAVPEVVAQRVMRMWMAGTPMSQRDRDEFHRMYAEKFAAFYESWNAMALEMFRVSLTLGLFPVWTLTARNRKAGLRVLSAGLAPIHRRAAANAKRLRRIR